MVIFEDIQDVQEWLQLFDIEAFWEAVAPWQVFSSEDREHYDTVIAEGEVCPDLVLTCLKEMVRMELTERFNLSDRTYEPPDAKYLRRVH